MSCIVGRFAPSPTGELHLGSALIAIASYVSAKSQKGKWLVRIEDIDEHRTVPNMEEQILKALEYLKLVPDGEIWRQSQRKEIYQNFLEQLHSKNLIYPCFCSRKALQERLYHSSNPTIAYDNLCRTQKFSHFKKPYAIRIKVDASNTFSFNDLIQGWQQQNPADDGDFIIKRRDGYFSYHFATVIDDALSGVNEILRGVDILDSTIKHLYLQTLLQFSHPKYLHIPLVCDTNQIKYSKRNHAPNLFTYEARKIWIWALQKLGQASLSTLSEMSLAEIHLWALENWNASLIPKESIYEPLPSRNTK